MTYFYWSLGIALRFMFVYIISSLMARAYDQYLLITLHEKNPTIHFKSERPLVPSKKYLEKTKFESPTKPNEETVKNDNAIIVILTLNAPIVSIYKFPLTGIYTISFNFTIDDPEHVLPDMISHDTIFILIQHPSGSTSIHGFKSRTLSLNWSGIPLAANTEIFIRYSIANQTLFEYASRLSYVSQSETKHGSRKNEDKKTIFTLMNAIQINCDFDVFILAYLSPMSF